MQITLRVLPVQLQLPEVQALTWRADRAVDLDLRGCRCLAAQQCHALREEHRLCEADSSTLVQRLYGKVPRVRVPNIHWQATARRVLTMEWVKGCKVCFSFHHTFTLGPRTLGPGNRCSPGACEACGLVGSICCQHSCGRDSAGAGSMSIQLHQGQQLCWVLRAVMVQHDML